MSQQETCPNRQEQSGRVPIVCGGDAELGNFILGLQTPLGTGQIASRLLLRHIPGIPQSEVGDRRSEVGGRNSDFPLPTSDFPLPTSDFPLPTSAQTSTCGYDPQDWGRKFLASNGGCVYIDLNHLELCIPEVRSAFDYVAAWHAMLRIARKAQQAVNRRLPQGLRIEVLVNNSDGFGSSYGGHLNFLLSRRTWNNIFCRKMHYMLYLASYQISSIVFTGQGKVGAENGAPPVGYQLAQRADFLETISGLQTTYRRPIVNTRDEPLCGKADWGNCLQSDNGRQPRYDLARLHVIFYDSNLCHVACLLKVGVMQVVLAMLEAEQINPGLILDDPLETVVRWSHDPTLRATARTASGKRLTAVELQFCFLEQAQKFYDRGGCEGVVPRAGEILSLYADTLEKLRGGNLDALAGRLDWVLKLRALQQFIQQRPDLTWDAPQLKHLDHAYSSLDVGRGLYWTYEAAGLVERVQSADRIEQLVHQPPEDTRAWTRAMLLRLAGPGRVQQIDWDSITFKVTNRSLGPAKRTLNLPEPFGLNRADTGHLFRCGKTLDEMLDDLKKGDGSLFSSQGLPSDKNDSRPLFSPSHTTLSGEGLGTTGEVPVVQDSSLVAGPSSLIYGSSPDDGPKQEGGETDANTSTGRPGGDGRT